MGTYYDKEICFSHSDRHLSGDRYRNRKELFYVTEEDIAALESGAITAKQLRLKKVRRIVTLTAAHHARQH